MLELNSLSEDAGGPELLQVFWISWGWGSGVYLVEASRASCRAFWGVGGFPVSSQFHISLKEMCIAQGHPGCKEQGLTFDFEVFLMFREYCSTASRSGSLLNFSMGTLAHFVEGSALKALNPKPQFQIPTTINPQLDSQTPLRVKTLSP